MKKVLALIMVMVMVFSLCACGGGGSPATITDKEGNTVQMTAKELIKINDENETKFDKLYKEAKVTISGTVDSIKSDYIENGSSIRKDSIILKDGWEVVIVHGSHDDELVELSAGDKVEVESKIQSCFGSKVSVWVMTSKNPSGPYTDGTSITIQ